MHLRSGDVLWECGDVGAHDQEQEQGVGIQSEAFQEDYEQGFATSVACGKPQVAQVLVCS